MNALKKTLSFALFAATLAGVSAANASYNDSNALPKFDLATPKTSQQVQAELAQARAAGLTDVRPNDLPRLHVGAPQSRAQVQAELQRARSAGEIESVVN